ncbi:MAG TPA: helix-turn-helix domain-containing protein [Actinomycetota bacterium]|nr:helix-turn-helix domain-containing protein [Actinomycetota bacterium]
MAVAKASARRRPARAHPPAEPLERPSLEDVVRLLGANVARVVVAPRGLQVPAGDPVIHDPVEQPVVAADALVLAVGTQPGTSQAVRLIKEAAHADAAAVVFKDHDDVAALSDGAETAGIAVVAVSGEMTWTQLHGLLVNAVRFVPHASTGGIGGVPIGDLFALSNAIAGMVGGAVTIEDQHRRVLAYSTLEGQPIDEGRRLSILGRQVPELPGMRDLYKKLAASDGVMVADRAMLKRYLGAGPAEMQNLQPRAAVSVRAGDEIIGSIWVAGQKAFTDEQVRALADAARIAVPHMIQARATRDVERRMRAETVRALLDGRGYSDAAAARLGLSPAGPLAVLAFRFTRTDADIEELHRERLVDLVSVYCEAYRRQTAAVAIGSTVYVVMHVDKSTEHERLMRLAQEIATHAETRLRMPLHASVASVAESMRTLPRARREADRVLQVLADDAKGRTIAGVDDVRSRVVLLELRDLCIEHPELARGKLEQIVTHDAEHGTAYIDTLRAYLDAFGDVPTAAARILVHPNTFRYRLRRLLEIFDLDLDDAEERLVLSLQLRLLSAQP